MDKALGMQNPMVDNVVLLVSRLLLAGLFVHEGVFLAANFAAASTAMAKVGIPALAVIGTIALQLVAGIAIAVGWHARLGAAALGLFCLATAILFHVNFANRNELLHFREGPRHRRRNVCLDVARRWGLFGWRICQSENQLRRWLATACSSL